MDSYLMLALAEGFGEGLVPALLDPDLDPERVLRLEPRQLDADGPRLPPRTVARLRDPGLAARAASVRRRCGDLGLAVLTPPDPDWPPRLRHVPLRPLVLFARGDPLALRRSPAAAVVGSRTPTPYGREAGEHLAAAFARAGTTLWSGLARGIDAIGHAACVAAGVPTVAVLAGGLDAIYPREHGDLTAAIVRGGGCLVGELPPGHRARRGHFPRRNRILALGTPAVVVVEASLTSGALHTARFAAECGVDVFAVPGPWASERSQGCHRLIVEGANLVEGPEALLRSLGVQAAQPAGAALGLCGSADEEAVLAQLAHGPRPADLVQRESGLERAAFLRAVFALQANGRLQRHPGDLIGRATSR